MPRRLLLATLAGCALTACSLAGGGGGGETGTVVDVIDGDTIDVDLGGEVVRVRYLQMNTPERDEVCYADAVQANADLVEGRTVTLVPDRTDTDRYDRLLRHVYVGNTHVNAEMVRQGYAEVVLYEPDDAYFDAFADLEDAATERALGCHPTGIFDDGNYER